MIKSERNEKSYNQSVEPEKSIRRGLQDLANGRIRSHEVVMLDYKRRYHITTE
jgi:hypothetical protein